MKKAGGFTFGATNTVGNTTNKKPAFNFGGSTASKKAAFTFGASAKNAGSSDIKQPATKKQKRQ